MSQLSYSQEFTRAMAGMPVNAGDPEFAVSAVALEKMDYGRAGFASNGSASASKIRGPKRNQSVQTWSGDFVTSNVINGTVNGVAIDPVTFASDHLATITALGAEIVAKLLAAGIVATAEVSGGTNRVLTITAEDAHVLLADFVVTLGSGQVTDTIVNGSADSVATILGITRNSQQPPRRSDGLGGYDVNDAAAAIRRGRVYAEISADVALGDQVYVDLTSGNEGKLTNVTTAPNVQVPGARFAEIATASGLGLAAVEINLP